MPHCALAMAGEYECWQKSKGGLKKSKGRAPLDFALIYALIVSEADFQLSRIEVRRYAGAQVRS